MGWMGWDGVDGWSGWDGLGWDGLEVWILNGMDMCGACYVYRNPQHTSVVHGGIYFR